MEHMNKVVVNTMVKRDIKEKQLTESEDTHKNLHMKQQYVKLDNLFTKINNQVCVMMKSPR